jgi:hypothetical protein
VHSIYRRSAELTGSPAFQAESSGDSRPRGNLFGFGLSEPKRLGGKAWYHWLNELEARRWGPRALEGVLNEISEQREVELQPALPAPMGRLRSGLATPSSTSCLAIHHDSGDHLREVGTVVLALLDRPALGTSRQRCAGAIRSRRQTAGAAR